MTSAILCIHISRVRRVTRLREPFSMLECSKTATFIKLLYFGKGRSTLFQDWAEFKVFLLNLTCLGTADDELWPLIQKKLDVLNKAGLSKDNFMDSESHSVVTTTSPVNKITDYFSTSLTEEDMAALDEDWDGTNDQEENMAKKPRL